jgi:hypothetical protein
MDTWVRAQGLGPEVSVVGGMVYVAGMMALLAGLAFASFHGWEKPFLNLKRWFPSA